MNQLVLFERQQVRRASHDGAWWFVIVDAAEGLSDSANPEGYVRSSRRRDPPLSGVFKGGGQFAPPLAPKVATTGGNQKVLRWLTEGIFRPLQSIPSLEGERFKGRPNSLSHQAFAVQL